MKTKNTFSKVTGLVIALTLVFSTAAKASVNSNPQKDTIEIAVRDLIAKNYGQINEDPRLGNGLNSYLHKKVTGEVIEVKENIADAYYSVSFEGTGSLDMILEIFQERFDKLKADGYPITPDRFLIKITEENGRTYLAVALDETYVYPQRIGNK
jgi:hypothetical protein